MRVKLPDGLRLPAGLILELDDQRGLAASVPWTPDRPVVLRPDGSGVFTAALYVALRSDPERRREGADPLCSRTVVVPRDTSRAEIELSIDAAAVAAAEAAVQAVKAR